MCMRSLQYYSPPPLALHLDIFLLVGLDLPGFLLVDCNNTSLYERVSLTPILLYASRIRRPAEHDMAGK